MSYHWLFLVLDPSWQSAEQITYQTLRNPLQPSNPNLPPSNPPSQLYKLEKRIFNHGSESLRQLYSGMDSARKSRNYAESGHIQLSMEPLIRSEPSLRRVRPRQPMHHTYLTQLLAYLASLQRGGRDTGSSERRLEKKESRR